MKLPLALFFKKSVGYIFVGTFLSSPVPLSNVSILHEHHTALLL